MSEPVPEYIHTEFALRRENAALATRVLELETAARGLLEYRAHQLGCEVEQTDFCTCGMKRAADAVRAAFGAHPEGRMNDTGHLALLRRAERAEARVRELEGALRNLVEDAHDHFSCSRGRPCPTCDAARAALGPTRRDA